MDENYDFFLEEDENGEVKTDDLTWKEGENPIEELTKESQKEEKEVEVTEEESEFSLFANSLLEEGLVIPKEGKEYDDSVEGLKELIQDTVELKKEELFSDIPESYKLLAEAAKNGVDVRDFIANVYDNGSEVVDYSAFTEEEIADEDNQELFIRDLLSRKNVKDKIIDNTIKNAKDDGSFGELATEALQELIESQQESAKEYLKNLEVSKKQQEEEYNKHLKDLRKSVDSLDEIQGFTLDKKTKDSFYDYITKPVDKSGKTKMQIDAENEELQMKMAFMYFSNFNIKDLENKVVNSTTTKFEKLLKSKKDPSLNTRSKNQVQEEATDEDINLFS